MRFFRVHGRVPLSIIDYRQGHKKTRIPEAYLTIWLAGTVGLCLTGFIIFLFFLLLLVIQSIPAGSGLRCVLGQCQLKRYDSASNHGKVISRLKEHPGMAVAIDRL